MSKWKILLITGITLGLGWAIRGHFGHWWGASWAGGMGALALILAIGRKDWIKRAPVLSLLSAVGWGIGGIMSYGILVGYCRSDELFNSVYGYFSLFVVGGLYGFIGGGLMGLGMATDSENRPDWFRLLLEMFVIGALAYWIIIIEMEWLMTPPRDESWAYCLGAAVALGWYQYRIGKINALRVALYSGLGGGFGFALGNLFQTLGTASGISYNWWNVMEFTLGLFGGIGMAYGVLTSEWKEKTEPSNRANWLTLLSLIFVIPAINIFQSFTDEKLFQLAEWKGITNAIDFALSIQVLVWALVIIFTILTIYYWRRVNTTDNSWINTFAVFGLLSILYTIFGIVRTGFFYTEGLIGNTVTAYWIFLPLILVLLYPGNNKIYVFKSEKLKLESWKFWVSVSVAIILFFLVIGLISTGSHDGLSGSHNRF